MEFQHGEHDPQQLPVEPWPLGIKPEPNSAALYNEFAQNRSLDQVYELWKDPQVTNPTVRQRAVTVLTAPDIVELPYPQPDKAIDRLLAISEEVDGHSTTSLRSRLAGRPELAQELAAGVLHWLGERIDGRPPLQVRRALPNYRTAIMELLPLIDERTADALFIYFPLYELRPHWEAADTSALDLVVELVEDREMPISYRRAALTKWRELAKQEITAGIEPGEPYLTAAFRMSQLAQTSLYAERVDKELVYELISFLEINLPRPNAYVNRISVARVAAQLDDAEFDAELRLRFAWRHVIAGPEAEGSRFWINSEQDLALVGELRTEAGRRGRLEYVSLFDEIVSEYESRRHAQVTAQQAEADLQARLRQPAVH